MTRFRTGNPFLIPGYCSTNLLLFVLLIFGIILAGCESRTRKDARAMLEAGIQKMSSDEQLFAFDQALAIDPAFARAFAAKAKIYYELNKYDLALENMNQAIELDPENEQYYHARANVHKALGNKEAVLEDETRASLLAQKPTFLIFKFLNFNMTSGMDWLTWLLGATAPIFVILFIKFGLPVAMQLDTGFRSAVTLIILNLLSACAAVFISFFMFASAPDAYGAASVGIGLLIFLFIVLADIIENIKHLLWSPRSRKHWICKECHTENNTEHLQCWKCGKKPARFRFR